MLVINLPDSLANNLPCLPHFTSCFLVFLKASCYLAVDPMFFCVLGFFLAVRGPLADPMFISAEIHTQPVILVITKVINCREQENK